MAFSRWETRCPAHGEYGLMGCERCSNAWKNLDRMKTNKNLFLLFAQDHWTVSEEPRVVGVFSTPERVKEAANRDEAIERDRVLNTPQYWAEVTVLNDTDERNDPVVSFGRNANGSWERGF